MLSATAAPTSARALVLLRVRLCTVRALGKPGMPAARPWCSRVDMPVARDKVLLAVPVAKCNRKSKRLPFQRTSAHATQADPRHGRRHWLVSMGARHDMVCRFVLFRPLLQRFDGRVSAARRKVRLWVVEWRWPDCDGPMSPGYVIMSMTWVNPLVHQNGTSTKHAISSMKSVLIECCRTKWSMIMRFSPYYASHMTCSLNIDFALTS